MRHANHGNLSEKQSKRHNEESGLAARATPYLLCSSKFDFEIYRLRFELVPVDPVILPRDNKANVIRGAFGTIFKQLCCGSVCQSCRDCPLRAGCAYADIFERSPPPDSCRLSANQDIPRPFVFRPPPDSKTRYGAGESFSFELLLFGKAAKYLAYFVVAFRELTERGFGIGRARCKLRSIMIQERSKAWSQLYSDADQCVRRAAPSSTVWELMSRATHRAEKITVEFVTPTELKCDGHSVPVPEFHHLMKRLRDRISAIGCFYGNASLDIDFIGLGQRAETVRRIDYQTTWVDRRRLSTRTGQRHSIGGFVGRFQFEGDLSEFMPFIYVGEWIHVGKHAVWGNGQYHIADLT